MHIFYGLIYPPVLILSYLNDAITVTLYTCGILDEHVAIGLVYIVFAPIKLAGSYIISTIIAELITWHHKRTLAGLLEIFQFGNLPR